MSVLLSDLRRLWSNANTDRRFAYTVVAVLMIVGIGYVASQTLAAEYSPIYSGLAGDDAAAIAQELETQGIPYRTGPGGSSVLVPTGQVETARLRVAAKGLPKGSGVGFEVFDRGGFGLSESQQKVNYQRALQGELERTIAKMDGVRSARVLIAQPADTLFVRDQQAPTASVLIETRGTALSSAQVRTIAFLVSRAVPRLKPEAVTISDTLGTPYSDALGEPGTAGGSTRQIEIKHAYERQLEASIANLLTPVLGSGKASVQVAVEFNWDTFERNATVLGDEPVVLSKQEKEESFQGSGSTSSGGTPGTSANLPTTGGASPRPGSGQDYTNKLTTTNFDVTRSVEKTVRAAGSIKKQSVSVVVDLPPTDAKIAEIRSAIGAAAGIDIARGDVLTVSGVQFDRTQLADATKKLEEERNSERLSEYMRLGGSAALLIAGAVLIFLLTRRRSPAVAVSAPAPGALPRIEDVRPSPAAEPTVPVRAVEMPPADDARRQRLETLQRVAEQRPEEAARVIQGILREQRGS